MTYKRYRLGRLSLGQLRARRRRLAGAFPDLADVMLGSLQSQRRRCGKEGCRCARGELHGPYVYLTARGAERSQLLYVPTELAAEVERRVAFGSRVEDALGEVSAINLELLARGALD